MGLEIERKFLVTGDGWRALATGSRRIEQGYLARGDKAVVRVRIVDGQAARLTIKSAAAEQARTEFEYAIPVEEARALLDLCEGACLRKRRYLVPRSDGGDWEVDVFEGMHAGLCIAEAELDAESAGAGLERPDWLGREVTGDPAYYNANLAKTIAR